MGISENLTCFLRNLYAGQEATVKARHGTTDWFQIGEEVSQGCILSPCLFNLYAGQEATLRTGHGTTDWFRIGKGVRQGCMLSPCSFNLYAEYIMRNVGLEETQA